METMVGSLGIVRFNQVFETARISHHALHTSDQALNACRQVRAPRGSTIPSPVCPVMAGSQGRWV